jgi:penicillin amidase
VKIVKIACIALLSLLLLTAMVGYFFFKSTIPVWQGVLRTGAVAQEVEIVRNPHGVPLIKAGENADLFFAIGFVHAQDRLFQMDCQRRAATGRLSEIFGTRTLERDIWQKYLQAETGIEKSFRALKPEAKALLEHYCRGVNYFLASQSLPPEFHILKYVPEPWQLRDVLAVMKYLESELTFSGGELNHARLLAALPPEQAHRWLAAPWPDFENGSALWPRAFAVPLLSRLLNAETEAARREPLGSAWAVSGSRTVSGQPCLANEFSWAPNMPALFYQVAGKTPLWELAGNTLPGVPFIFSGRNWQIGWGVHAFPSDTLDYFVLDRHPDHENLYRCDGQWLALKVREERIRCRGQRDFVLKLAFSKFGPVIEAKGCLLAVHSRVQYRSSAVEALYRMNSARNPREFAAALHKFSAPALRVVFADRKGNIGACQTGLLPLRGKGNGLLPLRARSTADLWQGFNETAGEKFIINPGRGWLSSADLASLGKAAPDFFKFDAAPDFQGQRLAQLLAGKGKLDMQAAARLQNDSRLPNAEFLIALIRDLPLASSGARHVRNVLAAWDLTATDGEGPAFFYEFEKFLATAIFTPGFRDPAAASGLVPEWIYPLLKYPELPGKETPNLNLPNSDNMLLDRKTFSAAVEKSLVETYDAYRGQIRNQNDGWRWESLHTVGFGHPLGTIFPLKPFFERGASAIKGGKYCLLNTDFEAGSGFKITRLAAYKMILDFSDFSRSLLAYPTGQSGHPLSPAYDDQMDMFAELKYLKMEDEGRRSYRLRLIPEENLKGR